MLMDLAVMLKVMAWCFHRLLSHLTGSPGANTRGSHKIKLGMVGACHHPEIFCVPTCFAREELMCGCTT